ncbi:MAG TPA: diguanylate cyclase [Gammaproteobacteria bacterium]
MTSAPRRLLFNRGLLLVFAFPLAIWMTVSIINVITLKDALRHYESVQSSERTIQLAGEYQDALSRLREGERVYLATSSSEALAGRDEALHRANALYDELRRLSRGEPVQIERLERAGTSLQRWFYDASLRRTQNDDLGPSLVQAFEESMTNFIATERETLAAGKLGITVAARRMQWVVWSGLALGIISMIAVVRWVATRIGRSVESIDQAAGELASGNMTARVHSEGKGSDLAERFNQLAELIEKRNEQQAVLAELGEMLHSCKSTDEGKEVFATFVDDLFPNKPGVLYFIESNRKDVQTVASWQGGEEHSATRMGIDECWALRLGRSHQNADDGKARCDHVRDVDEESRCIPLPAFGGVIGLLFLLEGRNVGVEYEQHKRFADTVAEQIALAFANIRLREKLKDQSIRDPLTELYNRRHLDEVMTLELSRAERHGEPLSVLAFDIDNFKRFNDAHGHDGGDALLKCIGETLNDFSRPEDGVFRSGGEEFITLLPGTGLDDAVLRAEELRKEIARLQVVHGNSTLPPVTISVGVASYPANGKDAGELLKAADRALYAAKDAGRDRVMSADGD